ncbi:hypothetical protein [Brevundimonas sp.]|uniref:hypothetical protein n=1 Tax=Brevundimonas sp. TaxID=1871086 RepID=UPI00391B2682
MLRTIAVTLTLCVLTGGCAMIDRVLPGRGEVTTEREIVVNTDGMPGVLEPIHAAAIIADHAVFRVTSGGCTDRDDIQPIITLVDDEAVVTLRRMHDDYCQAYAEDGLELIWTFEELGLTPGQRVRINNPYLDSL